MTAKELQEEEIEVLQSIYEGDACFKEVDSTTFQYKYGEDGDYKAFNVELLWGENYPMEAPTINLDTFYNKHIINSVKEKVKTGLLEQVEDLLECAMTFTLFEWVKENLEDLTAGQPDAPPVLQVQEKPVNNNAGETSKKKEKKEQFTKNQKRKMYDRLNAAGERPRGWNWVDVVRHLSQTGNK